jgi:hypothetical protein
MLQFYSELYPVMDFIRFFFMYCRKIIYEYIMQFITFRFFKTFKGFQ